MGFSSRKKGISRSPSRFAKGSKFGFKEGKSKEEIKKEILNKLSKDVKNFDKDKYSAYADFDFSDDVERKQRLKHYNEIF